MTQRTWAALLAVPLFVALGLYVAVTGLPFVTFAPGPTVNVLGDNDGKPIIEVTGHPTYPDDGQLRMTTVSVTERNARLDLFTLMRTWMSRHDAVYPFFSQYGTSGSQQQDTAEGQVEMVTSQDAAVAAALTQLGIPIHPAIEIVHVTDGMPAQGKLQVRDVLRRIGDTPITAEDRRARTRRRRAARQVGADHGRARRQARHRARGPGLEGREHPVRHPAADRLHVPLQGRGQHLRQHRWPQRRPDVRDLDLRHPHAGVADRRSGRRRDRHHQRRRRRSARSAASSRRSPAPGPTAPSCSSCRPRTVPTRWAADNGSMRLVKAPTLGRAISEIKAWTANHDAPLPSCEPASTGASS